MSGFLLDTNVVSELFRRTPNPRVVAWYRERDEDALFLSVLTPGEMRSGIARLPDDDGRRPTLEMHVADLVSRFGERVVGVDLAIAERWGALYGTARSRGRNVSVVDMLLAATALQRQLIIVTRNVQDFQETGVTVHNPFGD